MLLQWVFCVVFTEVAPPFSSRSLPFPSRKNIWLNWWIRWTVFVTSTVSYWRLRPTFTSRCKISHPHQKESYCTCCSAISYDLVENWMKFTMCHLLSLVFKFLGQGELTLPGLSPLISKISPEHCLMNQSLRWPIIRSMFGMASLMCSEPRIICLRVKTNRHKKSSEDCESAKTAKHQALLNDCRDLTNLNFTISRNVSLLLLVFSLFLANTPILRSELS